MWAKYAIYGAIDKIPQICRDLQIWGQSKFVKFDITGLNGVCSITHISICR
jgi:hypothetical protein